MADKPHRLRVHYCGVCVLPSEHCDYSPGIHKCRSCLHVHAPDLLNVRSNADQAVHPSSKPNPGKPLKTSLPTTKSQIDGRAGKPSSSAHRDLCRSCCLCFATLLPLLILLAAISVGIFYAVYRPRRPAFSVASLRVATLNVSGAGQLVATLIDLNVTARNSNKKLVFLYDPISVSVVLVSGSGGVNVGDGSYPGFVQEARSTKVLPTAVASGGLQLDATATADLKKSSSFGVNVEMRTKAGVKIGKLKTKKMEIEVLCDGINFAISKGKAVPAAYVEGIAR